MSKSSLSPMTARKAFPAQDRGQKGILTTEEIRIQATSLHAWYSTKHHRHYHRSIVRRDKEPPAVLMSRKFLNIALASSR